MLSAVIFNADHHRHADPAGAARREVPADRRGRALLRYNLLVYGLGGMIAPFIGIKIIDVILVGLHLTT